MGDIIKNNVKLEDDMIPRSCDESDKLSTKIFKVYPLVGDFSPSKKTLANWEEVTCKYVEKRLEKKSARFYDWVYDQVALTIVHYAKSWNSNEEGKFTKYAAMQLGYKDDNGKIWNLLTEALEKSFSRHNRLFIRRNGERQFYETVMVHSFGPSGAWYPLFDLLFSFYAENLDWTYVPGDPLFSKLVRVLQGYFNNTDVNEDQYDIASQQYSLRIGIRRLVQERPGYCAKFFEILIQRMHQLLENDEPEAKRYCHRLVDQWFAEKISRASMPAKRRLATPKASSDLALDYSNVTIRYTISEGRLSLRLPAIRLLGDEQGNISAELLDDKKTVRLYDLRIQGNELGETIRQNTIGLPTDLLESTDLKYRLIIRRGNTVIHDTENKLWRNIVFFSDGKEISANRIRKETYEAFVPDFGKLEGKNIDASRLPNGLCKIAFHKDFLLEYAGNIIAIDTSDIKGVRIVRPAVFDNVRFVFNGEDCYLLEKNTSIKVYCDGEIEARKYSVSINGDIYSLTEFFDFFSGNRAVIPFNEKEKSTSVSVIDIAAGTVIFKENYYFIPDFNCVFNRSVYVTDEEYNNLSARIICNGHTFPLVSADREEARFDYSGGTVIADVPGIDISYNEIPTIFFNRFIRAEDITELSELKLTNRSGVPLTLKVENDEFVNPGKIELYNYVSRENELSEKKDIALYVAGQRYLIGRILFGNAFATLPEITYSANSLFWDGGVAYIGDADALFHLFLLRDGKLYRSFELKLGEQLICSFDQDGFEDGYYNWAIYADDKPLCNGYGFIGNESKARFTDKIIQIDEVTEDIENNTKPVSIKTVYIDQIKYRDTCFVETEEDIYDVYSGCMYWVDWNGEHRYYSFKYNDKKLRYKVNPVKIIYISDKYLRIVNEDDEGIYYFCKDDSSYPGNEITDREPPAKAKNYHDILFYLFKTRMTSASSGIGDKKKTEEETATEISGILSKNKESESFEGTTINVNRRNHLFKNLKTVDQYTVIQAPVEQRILVNAGPGTGKTWTLIERVMHLVRNGIEPDAIQVLCFSRAAVDVIRGRISSAVTEGRVDISVNKVDVRTFDSFASQLLYWVKDSGYYEIRQDFRIESLNYEQRIALFIEVIQAQPGLIEQCEHLIVDEVQDLVLSRAEMVLDMIRLLPKSTGITLFGDACQAIYDYQVESGMSSEGFYREIEESRQFTYYSFDYNFRQDTQLQHYTETYRDAILSGEVDICNSKLSTISDILPDYNIVNIHDFEENSLDLLLNFGNIGILTRSNAQALVISGLFHRKNISHLLQRRLADNYWSGWIAVMFNSLPASSYDEEDFKKAFDLLFADEYKPNDCSEIWDAIAGFHSTTSVRITVADILRGIRDYGKASGFYLAMPETKVTVSTIHRSKGREYDSVIVLDSLISEQSDKPEEHRVNYVALSRAKQRMYKAGLPPVYFKTLENRRCYSTEKNFRTGKSYLSYFEVGRQGDFERKTFCIIPGVQEFLRKNMQKLRGSEVYLEKTDERVDGYISYHLILKDRDLLLGETGALFGDDLENAIRKTKNLPWHATVHDYVFPKRFGGIYIMDIASEIGMVLGNETGIREFDNLTTWNIVLAEGYAKAEY